jgi:hypothetical protein
MSGAEMQREKEKVAQKMREKQAAGESFRNRTLQSSELLANPTLSGREEGCRRCWWCEEVVDDIDNPIEIFDDARMVHAES